MIAKTVLLYGFLKSSLLIQMPTNSDEEKRITKFCLYLYIDYELSRWLSKSYKLFISVSAKIISCFCQKESLSVSRNKNEKGTQMLRAEQI